MAVVCHRHLDRPAAGVCNFCSVGLCGRCVERIHPPICLRCHQLVCDAEREAIISRVIVSGLLAIIAPIGVLAASALSSTLGTHAIPLRLSLALADHGIALMPIAIYTLSSIPYGYAVAKSWLSTPNKPISQSMPMLVIATAIVAPFLAPVGVLLDMQRWKQLTTPRKGRITQVRVSDVVPRRSIAPRIRPALPASRTPKTERGPSDGDPNDPQA